MNIIIKCSRLVFRSLSDQYSACTNYIHIHVQRYTYILAYMHEFIHKNKPPSIMALLSHRPQTTGNGIHSFIPNISIPEVTIRSATGNCKWRTCPRSLAWRVEQDSNTRPSGPKASTRPMCHHVPRILIGNCEKTIKWSSATATFIVVSWIQLLVNKNFFQILVFRFNCLKMCTWD